VSVRVEKVLGLLFSAGGMEFLFVEHQWNLVGIEVQAQDRQPVGILPIQQVIPGIAGPGGFEKLLEI
jgi:hypothetical protein